MLRSEVRCRLRIGLTTGSVVCCAFVFGGCSADVARFKLPWSGVTERSGSHFSPPIPREGVYPTSGAPYALETSSATGGAFARDPTNAAPIVPAVRSAAYTYEAPRQALASGVTSGTNKPLRKVIVASARKAVPRSTIKGPLVRSNLLKVAVAPHTAAPLDHSGSSLSVPTPATAQDTGEARPVQTHPVPNIINGVPKQVAALEPTEPVTNVVAVPEGGAAGSSAKRAEEHSPMATVPPSKFRWPVKGRVIAGFGANPHGSHNDGVNIAVPLGTEVLAAESGVVAYAGNELEGYGNLILIRHDNGWVTAYAHNDQILVNRDDRVRRGQAIAKAGRSGAVEQPQVHFEIRQGALPVDPLAHLE
jgi:murein DD-endopeptidase MepM/ murein hydrolase activator NlpD